MENIITNYLLFTDFNTIDGNTRKLKLHIVLCTIKLQQKRSYGKHNSYLKQDNTIDDHKRKLELHIVL